MPYKAAPSGMKEKIQDIIAKLYGIGERKVLMGYGDRCKKSISHLHFVRKYLKGLKIKLR